MPTCRWASCPSISRSSGFKPSINAGIVEFGLSVRFAHIAQRVQALQDGLAARAGAFAASEEAATAGRFCCCSGVICSHTCCRSRRACCWRESGGSRLRGAGESAPAAPAADSESAGYSAGMFLRGRRHILKPLDGLRRQIICDCRAGRHAHSEPGPHSWPLLRLSGRRALLVAEPRWAFCGRTRNRTRARGQPGGQNTPNWNRSFITWFLFSFSCRGAGNGKFGKRVEFRDHVKILQHRQIADHAKIGFRRNLTLLLAIGSLAYD